MPGIIPKPIKKTPNLYKFSPYIVFGLVVAVILTYAVLLFLENKTSKISSDLSEKISQVGTKEDKILEAQVLIEKQKINEFSKIFASHQEPSNFFNFLEVNSHPKIWFDKLELSSKDSQAILSGETSNFQVLGQQIAIFQAQESVKAVEVYDLSIGKSGQAEFTIFLSLDPKIFQ